MNKNKLNKIALTLLTVAFGTGGFLAGSKERHIALVLADKTSEEVQSNVSVAQIATNKEAGLANVLTTIKKKPAVPVASVQVKSPVPTQGVVDTIPPVNYAPAPVPTPTTKVS